MQEHLKNEFCDVFDVGRNYQQLIINTFGVWVEKFCGFVFWEETILRRSWTKQALTL